MGMKKMLTVLAFCFLLSFSLGLGYTTEENDAAYANQLQNPGKITITWDSGHTYTNDEYKDECQKTDEYVAYTYTGLLNYKPKNVLREYCINEEDCSSYSSDVNSLLKHDYGENELGIPVITEGTLETATIYYVDVSCDYGCVSRDNNADYCISQAEYQTAREERVSDSSIDLNPGIGNCEQNDQDASNQLQTSSTTYSDVGFWAQDHCKSATGNDGDLREYYCEDDRSGLTQKTLTSIWYYDADCDYGCVAAKGDFADFCARDDWHEKTCTSNTECASGYSCDKTSRECVSSSGETSVVIPMVSFSTDYSELGTEDDTTGARFDNGLLGEFGLDTVAECTDYTDCADDEVCVEGLCAGYCGFGDAVCSNGLDDDSDGSYDYYGACQVEGVIYPCQEDEEHVRQIAQEYCYFYNAIGEWDNCDEYESSAYLEADSDCVSPLDTSEGTVSAATTESKQSRLGSSTEGILSGSGSGDSTSSTIGSGSPLSRAAESDQGIFTRFYEWIIFWN